MYFSLGVSVKPGVNVFLYITIDIMFSSHYREIARFINEDSHYTLLVIITMIF